MDLATGTCVLAGTLLVSSGAIAAPCAPAAAVAGDPTLSTAIGELLASHGIAATDSPECPAVQVEVAPRGTAIAVVRMAPGEIAARELVVAGVATAAALIESWTHSDLDSSLFALHAPPSTSEPPATAPLVRMLPAPAPRTIQAFGALETSFADDRTSWLGVAIGACVQIGTVCASVRGRYAAVAEGPAGWTNVERHAEDVLFGGDIPLRVGATTLSFGFGAGMGATHTGIEDMRGVRGSETFGLRADAHVAWAIPIHHAFAIDLSASVDISQVTDVETSSTTMLADEPRVLARLGAGVRFGSR